MFESLPALTTVVITLLTIFSLFIVIGVAELFEDLSHLTGIYKGERFVSDQALSAMRFSHLYHYRNAHRILEFIFYEYLLEVKAEIGIVIGSLLFCVILLQFVFGFYVVGVFLLALVLSPVMSLSTVFITFYATPSKLRI